MRSLVLAGRKNGALDPATLNAVTAATRVGAEIDLLVVGSEGADLDAVLRDAAGICGISKLLCATAAHYADPSPENVAALLVGLASGYTHLFAPATAFWKSALPRAAALLDVAPISDIVAVESPEIFVRPVHAASALMRVRSLDPVKLLTVRPTAFEAAPSGSAGSKNALFERIPAAGDLAMSRIVSRAAGEEGCSGRPDLSTARAVVSGGRGLGSAENYRRLLVPLADCLGAALGATRAAVDGGFASSEMQVGQTGKIVAPDLYVAVGLSGAIQHLVGMKDSRFIVAINKDAEAPIFQVADCGLVADVFDALPELTEALRKKLNDCL
ncbi:MAG: FAD-binding protein [Candidatus Accumulibacter sp.]|nr:FAD-binding protein [Accumulibacter sp.]